MKISKINIYMLKPEDKMLSFLEIITDSGLTGYGEMMGVGKDIYSVQIAKDIAKSLLDSNPLNIHECLDKAHKFRVPLYLDKVEVIAWSAFSQALWDIYSKEKNLPLYAMFGGAYLKKIRLYANLNRGLMNKRSPSDFAKHAKLAIENGFLMAKCTPFDELDPSMHDKAVLKNGLERLKAAVSEVGAENIAIDCHWRFNKSMAYKLFEELDKIGRFFWLEDIFAKDIELPKHNSYAGGEIIWSLAQGLEYLQKNEQINYFMPDIKYFTRLEDFYALCLAGKAHNKILSPHNPTGFISQAFSAHLASVVNYNSLIEYPFYVEKERFKMAENEPIENGYYLLDDSAGIGVQPSKELLKNARLIEV